MKVIVAMSVAVALLAVSANAQSPTWPEPIANRLQDLTQRFIHCSAVFSVLAFVIDRNDDLAQSNAARKYIQYSDLMRVSAAKLAAEVNQGLEVINRQWEASAKRLFAEIHDQNPNFSVVLSRYRDSCADLHKDVTRHTRAALFGQ
jgi:hypothetical protein